MARSKAGLKKVTKTVRGKKGNVRRSYWVKAGERNLASFRKGPKMASAKMGAKFGFVSGLVGAHRVPEAALISWGLAQTTAAHMRKKAGHHGNSFGSHVKNYLATEVGHSAGHAAGSLAHEGIRRVLGRKSAFGGRGGYG